VNCPPFPISLSFWVELVGACNSIKMPLGTRSLGHEASFCFYNVKDSRDFSFLTILGHEARALLLHCLGRVSIQERKRTTTNE
jgi:hypothetical protein